MPLLRYMPLPSVVILYRGELDQRIALSKRSKGEKAAYALGVIYFAHNLNGQNLFKKKTYSLCLLHHLSFFFILRRKSCLQVSESENSGLGNLLGFLP